MIWIALCPGLILCIVHIFTVLHPHLLGLLRYASQCTMFFSYFVPHFYAFFAYSMLNECILYNGNDFYIPSTHFISESAEWFSFKFNICVPYKKFSEKFNFGLYLSIVTPKLHEWVFFSFLIVHHKKKLILDNIDHIKFTTFIWDFCHYGECLISSWLCSGISVVWLALQY